MKKTSAFSLLLLALFFVQNAQAQITITRKDYTVNSASDSIFTRTCFVGGVAAPTIGNNLTWDYTTLKDSTKGNFTGVFPIINPVSKFAPPFEAANFFLDQTAALGLIPDSIRYYYLLDSTGYSTIGYRRSKDIVTNVSAISGTATDNVAIKSKTTVFKTPYTAALYRFPITSKTSQALSIIDTINFVLNINSSGLTDAPSSLITREFDTTRTVGWGSVKVLGANGAAFSYQVLLVQSVTKQLDSFFTAGAPTSATLLGTFGLKQGNVRLSSTYAFIGLGRNSPLLLFYVAADGKTITRIEGINTSKLLTDVKDFQTVVSNVFPNPVKNSQTLTFNFDKQSSTDWYIALFNTAGQSESLFTVKGAEGATQFNATLPSNLSSGLHFYNIVDGNALIRSSGKFVVVNE